MEEKGELYEVRTMGERFSATSDFVRENWKALVKNLLPAGLILALLSGICMQYYVKDVFALASNPMAIVAINWWAYAGLMITAILFSLFIYAMTGAILYKHAQKSLTPETGWADLKKDFFPIAGKVFIQSLIIGLIVLVFSGVMVGMGIMFWILTMIFAVLFVALLIVFIPGLSLMQYPIYFERASAWKGITKGFKWGFKSWGSTFLSVILGGLILMVCVYILAMPYTIYIVFNMGGGGWLGYLLSALIFVATLCFQPLYIIFLGFQYTSIASRLSCAN
jgi:hypothetical protein